MLRRIGLSSLGAAALLSTFFAARAEQQPADRIGAARDAMAAIASALDAYAKAEPEESATRSAIDELKGAEGEPPSPQPGVPADVLEQDRLAAFDDKVSEVSGRLRERRAELLHGSADPEPPAQASQSAVLDIQSIVGEVADSPGPILGIPLKDGGDPLGGVKGHSRAFDQDSLDLLFGQLFEGSEGTWTASNGLLHVKGTPGEVARAHAFVGLLREATCKRIALDVRAYRMKRDLWRELAKGGVALAAEDEAKLGAAVAEGRATLLAGQTLVARDGQLVHAWRGSSRTYVSGLELNQSGAVPVPGAATDRIDTGLCAEIRAAVDATGAGVLLDASVALCEPRESAREKIQGFEIELPELASSRIVTTVAVPFGRGALVAGTFHDPAAGLDAPLASVLYVRATLVPPSAEGKKTVVAAPVVPAPAAPRPLRADLTDAEKNEADRLGALLAKIDRGLEVVREARKYGWQIFDIRELTEGRRDHAMPRLGLPPRARPVLVNGAPVPAPAEEDDGKRERALTPDTIDLIAHTESGAAATWNSNRGALRVAGGNLLVFQTPGAIAAVASTLRALETTRTRVVLLEAGLYELSPALAAALQDGARDGSLDRARLAKVDESARLLASGFIAARTGDRVHVQQGIERAYVSTYEGWSGGTGERIDKGLLPVISSIRAGLALDARVREEPSGALAVDAQVTIARLKELARSTTPEGPIAAPVLDMDELAATAPIAPGGGALVTVTKDGKTLALVIRASAP